MPSYLVAPWLGPLESTGIESFVPEDPSQFSLDPSCSNKQQKDKETCYAKTCHVMMHGICTCK